MNNESKKLFNSPAWAIDAPTNRAEFDDPTITPQIDPGQGWGSDFSEQDGELVDRRHMNEVFCRTTSAAKIIIEGIPQHQMDINYEKWAVTNEKGILYISNKETGPATSNAVSPSTPNQTVWERIQGSKKEPDAPESFQGTTPSINTIVAQWKAGKDNGAKIKSWKFQHKQDGGIWSTEETLQFPYKKITGLIAGQKYQVRSKGTNDIGDGDWGYSTLGATGFTPIGTVPGGGATLSLVAEAGDGEVKLKWIEPDDGGYPITTYIIQYRLFNESYNSTNKAEEPGSSLSTDIQDLINGQLYFFQVTARNQEGDGPVSNQAQATPKEKIPEEFQPTLNSPDLVALSTTSISATASISPSSTGRTSASVSYSWQYRQTGNSNWISATGANQTIIVDSILPETSYDVRYELTTKLGSVGHSPASTIKTLAPQVEAIAYSQPIAKKPTITEISSTTLSIRPHVTFDSQLDLPNPTLEQIQWTYKITNKETGRSSSNKFTNPWSNNQIEVDLSAGDVLSVWYAVRTTSNTSGSWVNSPKAVSERKTSKPSKPKNISLSSANRVHTRYIDSSRQGPFPGQYVGWNNTPSFVSITFKMKLPEYGEAGYLDITGYAAKVYRNGSYYTTVRKITSYSTYSEFYLPVGQIRVGDSIEIEVQSFNRWGGSDFSDKTDSVAVGREYV